MQVEHEEHRRRFVVRSDSGLAELSYQVTGDGALDLRHTFVPPEVRDQGVAAALVEYAVQLARQNQQKIIPTCPFVSAWMRAHPQASDVLQR
jgi:predicted GNAT family acetyltransferase